MNEAVIHLIWIFSVEIIRWTNVTLMNSSDILILNGLRQTQRSW